MIRYRAISNAYDGRTPEIAENYIKDLIVFGTNQIESLHLLFINIILVAANPNQFNCPLTPKSIIHSFKG